MSKKVLITGGNGFIGSHLIQAALKRGYKVTAIIRESSNIDLLEGLKLEIVRVNYHDRADLISKIQGLGDKLDMVIHCAGVVDARNEKGFYRGNVEVTENLLSAVKESEQLKGKFVHFSSLAARGPMEVFRKTMDDSPISAYGRSKLEAERLVRQAGLSHLIIRPTAVYGPRDKAFLELAKALKSGIEITLGNRHQKLTMIHASDLSEMIFEAAEEEIEVIYGYDGCTYTQFDISTAIKKAIGKKSTFKIWIPKGLFFFITKIMNLFTDLLLNQNWTYTIDKAKELTADDWSIEQVEDLHFQSQFDLEKGFMNTIEAYRKDGWL